MFHSRGAREYLKRLDVVKNTIIVWRLRRQLPRRRSAGQSRVEDFAAILVDNLGCFRCVAAPRFFLLNSERTTALEYHMDDILGAWTPRAKK